MLTGDNAVTAGAIARKAGIDRVIAGVLPDGKAEAIRALQQQGEQVAMALSMPPHWRRPMSVLRWAAAVADALAIAQATLRNMKQNLLGAFIYNACGIPIAAGVLFPLTRTLLSPVVAGAAMALSSITVVSNANRLIRYRPPQA